MNIDKTKLFENFANFKNIANVNILKCYHNLFDKIGIITNVGCYVISFIIIFRLISVFIFYLKQKYIIKQKINKLDNGINANFNMIINGNQKKSNENKINNIIEDNNKDIINKRKKIKSKKRKKKNNKKIIILTLYQKKINLKILFKIIIILFNLMLRIITETKENQKGQKIAKMTVK
jgi:hypothetical protein